MKPITLISILSLFLFNCGKKDELKKTVNEFQLSKLSRLPSVIKESSGVEMAGAGGFWSFNDSNGSTDLYRFDGSGKLLQTLNIENAENNDWEDIAKDESGNLYVGDFGNNENDRKNLRVYKLLKEDLDQNSNVITAKKIKFSFSDQTDFPPNFDSRFFDVESMFAKGDYLYLLTKDRSVPFVGKTRLYRLPNEPGEHVAEYLDEFFTHTDKNKGAITAADISPDGSSIVLLSNEAIWLFKNITGEDFFWSSGTSMRFFEGH